MAYQDVGNEYQSSDDSANGLIDFNEKRIGKPKSSFATSICKPPARAVRQRVEQLRGQLARKYHNVRIGKEWSDMTNGKRR